MFGVQVSVFVKLTFPILFVSVKQIVIYVNTDKRKYRCKLARVQQGFLLTAGSRLKNRLLALSIEPPTFPANRGMVIDNCLILQPSHLLLNLLRTL